MEICKVGLKLMGGKNSLNFIILLPETTYWFIPKQIKMKIFVTVALLSFSFPGFSQIVQDFTLVNVADGKNVSLNGFTSCQGIAVIFTSNDCAYDIQYRDRIKELNDQYKGKIQFLLINSHVDPKEDAKIMAQQFASWDLPMPYLSDKSQVGMGCLGATKSPEVFLLKKSGLANTIVYKGAIDDNPLVSGDVNNAYLKIAIDQLLANKKIEVPRNRVAGCTIRKK